MKITAKRKFAASAAGMAIMAAGTPAFAQTTGDASASTTAGEIIVTAQKRSENIQKVPLSIAVLSADQLQNQNVKNLMGIASQTAGVVAGAGGGTGETGGGSSYQVGLPIIRNFQSATTSGEPPVSLLVDDVYIGHVNTQNLPLYDIGRVEVVKGPQGTLFGRNTIGGAISVVPVKPGAVLEGYAKAAVTSYGSTGFEGAITLPISDVWSTRFSFVKNDSPGRFRNIVLQNKVGRVENAGVRAQVMGTFDNGSIRLSADWNRQLSDGQGDWHNVICIAVNPTCDPSGPVSATNPVVPRADVYSKGLSLHVERSLGTLLLTSTTSYRDEKFVLRSDFDLMPVNLLIQNKDNVWHDFMEEARLASDNGAEAVFNWFLGVNYYRSRAKEDWAFGYGGDGVRLGLTNNGLPAIPTFDGDLVQYANHYQSQLTTSLGFYGEVQVKLLEGLKLTLGDRYTTDRISQDQFNQALPTGTIRTYYGAGAFTDTGGSTVFTKTTQHGHTPRVVLNWQATPDIMVYATYARGYKTGLINNTNPYLPIVPPEKVANYEGGIKAALFNHRVTENISVYKEEYTNLISRVIVNGVTSYQPSAVKSWGIESDFRAMPFDGLTITNSSAYQKPTYDAFIFNGVSLAGRRQQFIPRFSSVTTVSYTPDIALPGGWQMTGTVEEVHRSKVTILLNTAAQYGTPASTLAKYDLWNARLAFSDPDARYQVGFFARNIFNKKIATDLGAGTLNVVLHQSNSAGGWYGMDLRAKF